VMRGKLALPDPAGMNPDQDDVDTAMINEFLGLMERDKVDFTLGFRRLADAADADEDTWLDLFSGQRQPASDWLGVWRERRRMVQPSGSDHGLASEQLRRANPIYIPRNHRVEAALQAASEHGDMAVFEQVLEAIRRPYVERPGHEPDAEPAPPEVTSRYQTFCGT